MAVYTPLTHDEIAEYLTRYNVGTLVSAKGITEGVENTNYLLTVIPAEAGIQTPQQVRGDKYILTLFEQRSRMEDLPYFVSLMQHFSKRGVPCPLPIAKKDGGVLGALKEKPAMMVSFLEGSGVHAIRMEHMPQLGALVANMHIAGMDFPHKRENQLSVDGWEDLRHKIGDRADEIEAGLADILKEECIYLTEHWPSTLPEGAIHADLFPDNVFFLRDRGAFKLSGVIDFYFSCHDMWAYDLAICINSWCFDDRHKFVPERAQALLAAYNDVRPMTDEEGRAMPILLRGAALRFLLTRAYDWINTPADAQVVKKDPLEYLAKLSFFQKQAL
ncbi:MAG: homoserine kinase [Alphaproteobacteria bacterium]